jgi:hypothetical protein
LSGGPDDEVPSRSARLWTIAAIWVLGLAAGFFAIVAATAKYGCAAADDGPACTTAGSVFSLVLAAGVVVTVGVVTAILLSAAPGSGRRIRRATTTGLALLVLALAVAVTLVGTS